MDPTQIVVFVDTTAGVPCDVDRIEVSVAGTAAGSVPIPITPDTVFPVSVTVSPDSGLTQARVEVVGLKDGTPILRSVSDAVFQDNEILALSMPLTANCTSDAPCNVAGGVLPRFTSAPAPLTKRDCEVVVCTPTSETETVCDGMDDDCDGAIDEDGVCPDTVRRYEVEVDNFSTFEDACQGVIPIRERVLSSVDGAEVGAGDIILPQLTEAGFDFDFYGAPVRNLFVGDNGYITFGDSTPNAQDRTVGPADGSGVPRPGVLAFWDTLETRAAGVCIGLDGTGDNQRLLITWSGACFVPCSPSDAVNVTVTLEESSGDIVVAYGEMSAADPPRALGSGATVGVVSANRTCPGACGGDGLCVSGANAGMPCGLTQVFSGAAQSSLTAYRFSPVVEN